MRLPIADNTRVASPAAAQGRGFVCSLLLHGLVAMLIAMFLVRPEAQTPLARFLPVELVPSPPAQRAPQPAKSAAAAPSRTRPARVVPSSPRNPATLSPAKHRPPPDALELRLKQLALLRQPDSTLPHADNGASDIASDNDGSAATGAPYRVRDYLRAQIERRWSLDPARAGNTSVRIRVVLAPGGAVTRAEIVDRARYTSDAAWRRLAQSARNAVVLSSPLSLPSGVTGPLEVTLSLDPKEAMR